MTADLRREAAVLEDRRAVVRLTRRGRLARTAAVGALLAGAFALGMVDRCWDGHGYSSCQATP